MNKDVEMILNYEIYSSWWADRLSHPLLQKMAANYYAWKVRRKYTRFKANIERAKRVFKYREETFLK